MDAPLTLAGRSAALMLMIALTANTLIVAVSPYNTGLEHVIAVLSGVAGVMMAARLLAFARFSLAAGMSALVWALTFLNLGINNQREDTPYDTAVLLRQGGLFLAFFLASLALLFIERRYGSADAAPRYGAAGGRGER